MKGKILEFPKQRYTGYFGGCPTCRSDDGYLNIGRDHWFVCERHRVCWYVGMNLFSSWRHETPEDCERNKALLSGFRVVEPVYFPEPDPEPDLERVAPDDSSIPF